MTVSIDPIRTPVLVVGAGPVGLALANLLGREDVPCTLLEKRVEPHTQSRAIGWTPPSLELLKRIGVAEPMIQAGVLVTVARVYDDKQEVGAVRFDQLPGEFPFILTLPQSDAVRMLRDALKDCPAVTYRPGTELTGLSATDTHVVARMVSDGNRPESIATPRLVGCDGRYSVTRDGMGFVSDYKRYRPSFVMADYEDPTDWGAEARLFFTAGGSLESFPLPGNQRRWVALLPASGTDDPGGFLEEQVARLAHVDVQDVKGSRPGTFQPERLLVRRFVKGRVILAGDAAHVMSPIGGQGMNTGLGDVEQLAPLLAGIYHGALPENRLESYGRDRRQAFRVACRRNACGMWLGTRTGRWVSRWRATMLQWALNRPSPKRRLARHFAMIAPRNGWACRTRLSSPEQKRELNIDIFSAIAAEYGWMTGVLSLGRDAVWKRRLVSALPDVEQPVCVDLACGHGDLAALLRHRFPEARITAIDLTPAMLARARSRLEPMSIRCEAGDMMQTGWPSSAADIVTIGYGLRNAPDLRGALEEVRRMLKPGGLLGILDFSRYDTGCVAAVELFMLRVWGGLWGWLRTRNTETYGYIAESLALFPSRRAFHALLEEYGFEIRSARRVFFGFMEILVVQKQGNWTGCRDVPG